MRKGDIILVASGSYLTPLLSTIVSILYLGTAAGARLWIGCALVIIGAITCKLAVHEP
jgi:drug/metabolite transporter (DMT)-like permease